MLLPARPVAVAAGRTRMEFLCGLSGDGSHMDASCIDTRSLYDKAQHLAAIHKSPKNCWKVLVKAMLDLGWSAKDTANKAGLVQDVTGKLPHKWAKLFLPDNLVVE